MPKSIRTPESVAAYRRKWEQETEVPYGYCWCGCGEQTATAAQSHTKNGYLHGEPIRWLPGHHTRAFSTAHTIEDRGYTTPCWISNRSKMHKGHAQLRIKKQQYLAHRLAYETEHGPIPQGMVVHHLCRQPACIRVSHLALMTHGEHTTLHLNERWAKRP